MATLPAVVDHAGQQGEGAGADRRPGAVAEATAMTQWRKDRSAWLLVRGSSGLWCTAKMASQSAWLWSVGRQAGQPAAVRPPPARADPQALAYPRAGRTPKAGDCWAGGNCSADSGPAVRVLL